MKNEKLKPKEIRRRCALIHPELQQVRDKIIEFGNKALYAEQEEKMWLKRLWKIQLLCPHKNRGNERKERDLPPNKHDWTCQDCGFSNWYDNDKKFEKELKKLPGVKSKQKMKAHKART